MLGFVNPLALAAGTLVTVTAWAGPAASHPVTLDAGLAPYVGADGVVRSARRLVSARPLCDVPVRVTRGQLADAAAAALRAPADPVEAAVVIMGRRPSGGMMPLIQFNVTGTPPAGALTTLQAVADLYATAFDDNVTVSIDVVFSAAAFGTATLVLFDADYGDVRQFLIDDADSDDAVQAALPMMTLPVQDAIGGPVRQESTVVCTSATFKALGAGPTAMVDATITLGPGLDTGGLLDYDAADGVSLFGFSALDVIAHEVGHVLGFASALGGPTPDPRALDLFRFDAAALPADAAAFATTPRLLDATSASSGAHRFSDTVTTAALENGATFQSSHWENRDAMPIGIMDPQLVNGTTLGPGVLTPADIAAFDAIGWDFPPAPTAMGCNIADISPLGMPDFVLNVNDIVDFANAFNAMNPIADVSPPGGDGVFNVNDIVDFANQFNAGCP